jgi:NDP-hexose 2,3-enoyl reductase
MRYRNLGRSGLRVSEAVLGTMNFGPETSEGDAHRLMSEAMERGVNLLDTADVYGADANRTAGGVDARKGLTEEIIGRWWAESPRRREQVMVATKVYGTMGPGPNDSGLSARHIRRACDASLRRLQADHIDLYLLHHVDRSTPWDEVWDALSLLHQQGKVLYFGTSNHAAWQIVDGQHAARARGVLGLVAEQSLYNLMQRSAELEVIPACMAHGVGLIAYSPLNSGLLAGALDKPDKAARSNSSRAVAGMTTASEQIKRYEDLCRALGEHPAVIGQAWLHHQPGVTAWVVGARTSAHLDAGLRALDVTLGEAELRQLDAIFPGPGTAPEAYAW